MKVILKQAEKCMICGNPTEVENVIEREDADGYYDDLRSFLAGARLFGVIESLEITYRARNSIEDGEKQ